MVGTLRLALPLNLVSLVCLLCAACAPSLPPPAWPEHQPLHQRADYARGAGAVEWSDRVRRNDGLVEYLKLVDGYLAELQQLYEARGRVSAYVAPAHAPPSHQQAVKDELMRIQTSADVLGPLVAQLLDVAAARGVFEALPEVREALRLAALEWSVMGLNQSVLRNHLRVLGSDSAACGAERGDVKKNPKGLPPWFTEARDSLQDAEDGALALTVEQKQRFQRIFGASHDQLRAMSQYGVYQAITPGTKPGEESWTFQVGSVQRRGATDSFRLDDRPRALRATCVFDAKSGRLLRGSDAVIDASGQPVRLAPRAP